MKTLNFQLKGTLADEDMLPAMVYLRGHAGVVRTNYAPMVTLLECKGMVRCSRLRYLVEKWRGRLIGWE